MDQGSETSNGGNFCNTIPRLPFYKKQTCDTINPQQLNFEKNPEKYKRHSMLTSVNTEKIDKILNQRHDTLDELSGSISGSDKDQLSPDQRKQYLFNKMITALKKDPSARSEKDIQAIMPFIKKVQLYSEQEEESMNLEKARLVS